MPTKLTFGIILDVWIYINRFSIKHLILNLFLYKTRSLGCVIYELITLNYAFDVNDQDCTREQRTARIREMVRSPEVPLPLINIAADHDLKKILEK